MRTPSTVSLLFLGALDAFYTLNSPKHQTLHANGQHRLWKVLRTDETRDLLGKTVSFLQEDTFGVELEVYGRGPTRLPEPLGFMCWYSI